MRFKAIVSKTRRAPAHWCSTLYLSFENLFGVFKLGNTVASGYKIETYSGVARGALGPRAQRGTYWGAALC